MTNLNKKDMELISNLVGFLIKSKDPLLKDLLNEILVLWDLSFNERSNSLFPKGTTTKTFEVIFKTKMLSEETKREIDIEKLIQKRFLNPGNDYE